MKNTTLGYPVILAFLIVTSAVSVGLFFREGNASDRVDIRKFPMIVGEWRGQDAKITEKEYKILETRNLISREYVNPKKESIYIFTIYSETNRRVFHPPEVCMVGSGMTLVDKRPERINTGKEPFLANKIYTEKGGYKGLVLYAYKAGNFYTDNYYVQQAYLALHQIFGRRVPGATIRVSMSMANGEKATLSALKGFLVKAVTIVDSLSAAQ